MLHKHRQIQNTDINNQSQPERCHTIDRPTPATPKAADGRSSRGSKLIESSQQSTPHEFRTYCPLPAEIGDLSSLTTNKMWCIRS